MKRYLNRIVLQEVVIGEKPTFKTEYKTQEYVRISLEKKTSSVRHF